MIVYQTETWIFYISLSDIKEPVKLLLVWEYRYVKCSRQVLILQFTASRGHSIDTRKNETKVSHKYKNYSSCINKMLIDPNLTSQSIKPSFL